MFEITLALKYLIPKGKSLSTALISIMSVAVISLVVWLVLVFLSVTTGIEKNWLNKLTSLHAPIRICPTKDYYNSYYYQIDSLTALSDYSYKTIGEKSESLVSDPFSIETDMEPGDLFPQNEGIDLVKSAFSALDEIQSFYPIRYQDYEISGALLRLKRPGGAILSQMSYLLTHPDQNPKFNALVIEEKTLPFQGDIPILLPKNFKDNGVNIGDTGFLSYTTATFASAQEQKIPIQVAGFYDPGLVSMGNKCLIVPKEITRTIHAASQTFSPDGTPTNGIFVWLDDIEKAELVKEKIENAFEKIGISKYWKVDTYKDFEFSKDLLLQFQSDKTLFLLIGVIILIVACCNIISLLVLLVNDKKGEIAILQSMGASFFSIASIFGLTGLILGCISSIIGSLLAIFTLKNIDSLVNFLSALQGHIAFNPAFFGKNLPNVLSTDALYFVIIVTPILSLIAGLIPALKAARIKPSPILRGE